MGFSRKMRRLKAKSYGEMGGEHARRLLLALRLGVIDSGTLGEATVSHDDWCSLLHRAGPCDCDPNITIQCQGGHTVMVGRDGLLVSSN